LEDLAGIDQCRPSNRHLNLAKFIGFGQRGAVPVLCGHTFTVALAAVAEQSSRGRAVKVQRPQLIRRQRLSLHFKRSTESSAVEFELNHASISRVQVVRVAAWGPLLWQLGHKGLGRVLTQLNQRGFMQAMSPTARQQLRGLRIGHGALVLAGVAVDVWQMAKAVRRSVSMRSALPATAQAARSLTTWGAVWAGAELFGTGGALMGLELGPGVVITTAIGATVGGCVGFFAGDWVAQQVESLGIAQTEPSV
jgi:hypothetical protein